MVEQYGHLHERAPPADSQVIAKISSILFQQIDEWRKHTRRLVSPRVSSVAAWCMYCRVQMSARVCVFVCVEDRSLLTVLIFFLWVCQCVHASIFSFPCAVVSEEVKQLTICIRFCKFEIFIVFVNVIYPYHAPTSEFGTCVVQSPPLARFTPTSRTPSDSN